MNSPQSQKLTTGSRVRRQTTEARAPKNRPMMVLPVDDRLVEDIFGEFGYNLLDQGRLNTREILMSVIVLIARKRLLEVGIGIHIIDKFDFDSDRQSVHCNLITTRESRGLCAVVGYFARELQIAIAVGNVKACL